MLVYETYSQKHKIEDKEVARVVDYIERHYSNVTGATKEHARNEKHEVTGVSRYYFEFFEHKKNKVSISIYQKKHVSGYRIEIYLNICLIASLPLNMASSNIPGLFGSFKTLFIK